MTVTGRLSIAIFGAIALLFSAGAAFGRTTVTLSDGWRFSKASAGAGAENPRFDDSTWREVSVPHTWTQVGGPHGKPFTTDDYAGPAWYRLHFTAPKAGAGDRTFLQFDGVGTIADVWLNGMYLGRHEGAFSRFRFDATRAIKHGGVNVLVVKADNSIPAPGSSTAHVIPLSGDFVMNGGLYRTVSLITANPVHVDLMDFGGPGVYAHAKAISSGAATIEVRTRVANDLAKRQNVRLSVRVEDASGKTVARRTQPVRADANAVGVAVTQLTVSTPHLWNGTEDPYLYKVVVTLHGPSGKTLDEVSQPLGLRTIAFDADKGFFLNGKHVFLHGGGMHQDLAGKGWAKTCADQKADFDIMQDMGANAVRFVHYQHDQCSYDEADRRGFVVWTEIPLVNQVSFDGTPASPELTANARQQLTELIRQNYNHPSVAMWSVGNETDLRTKRSGPSKAGSLIRELVALSHQEDPARPTAFADCCERLKAPDRDVLVGLTDIAGYNPYFGWYDEWGPISEVGPTLDKAHAAHPNLPIALSEYGAGAAVSQHTDNPAGGPINPMGRPHPEEYQGFFHELYWSQIIKRPYLWGAFIWSMFDMPAKGRHEGDTDDMNDKGLVTEDRSIRKDTFYFYRAIWNPAPTLHLVGRRYTDRPYAVLDVKAYSNALNAALFVNGKTAGTASCSDGICLWKGVHLDQGANELKAAATINGAEVADTIQWTFAGKANTVRIKAGDLSGYTTPHGERFGSDTYFHGGIGKSVNSPGTPAYGQAGVSATDDARLYDSYREGGDFSYAIPLPAGKYKVTLHFIEPVATKSNERVFEVKANGTVALRKVDVFAAARGKLKPYSRSFTVDVENGALTLEFHAIKGQALISACEITPI